MNKKLQWTRMNWITLQLWRVHLLTAHAIDSGQAPFSGAGQWGCTSQRVIIELGDIMSQ